MNKLIWVLLGVVFVLIGCQKSLIDVAERFVEQGNQALSVKDYSRAIVSFNNSLDQIPSQPEARFGLARSFHSLASNSGSSQLSLLDSAYNQVGFWKRAVELKNGSFEKNVDYQSFYNKVHVEYAVQLFKKGIYSQSLNVLNNTISIEKDSVNYLGYLQVTSFIYFSRSQDSIAIELGRLLIESYPEFESGYLDVGKMYWQVEDYEEALIVWSVGQERFPKNEELSYWVLEAMDKTGWLDD